MIDSKCCERYLKDSWIARRSYLQPMNNGTHPSPSRHPFVFSVDVEDYFQVEAFASLVDRSQWDNYPSRVVTSTYRVLDLLDRQQIKATFFILGWVAERHPALVREIVRRGHEPACHSYWHRLIYKLTPDEFRDDTRLAKTVVEQAAGEPVYGYRAPSFSIVERSFWALDILAELGFRYDSSIFTIRHDTYGYLAAPRFPFHVPVSSGEMIEFPMTTFDFRNRILPVGGGGYLRIFPFWYTRLGARQAQLQQVPFISYIHPWELDPEQPRLPGRWLSRLRHYTNLRQTEQKLEKLFRLGQFGPFRGSGLGSLADGRVFSGAPPVDLEIKG
jgi:polysaccharide deacetylase family protein (PEP-CTERM system associated)